MLTEPLGEPELCGFDHVQLIGAGATSRVYCAERVVDGRRFALKRLTRHLVRSSEALARLKRELELLQKLSHPGIVKVHDVIRWGGDPTLVMDLVEGEDLEARMARCGPIDAKEVEALARQLLSILASTHSAGIVHRDIKPHNIRVGSGGRVTLLDFGSACLDASSQLTATGTTVGTPEYMAPELFAGSVYDPRVDIFGLGATLYEALVGEPPQTADSLAELAWKRVHSPIPSVAERAPDTPERLVRFIDRCLSADPAARFSTASLAVWSLDHPDIERAFGDHRSQHPPCLHCDQPLPPGASCCPRCQSTHPFGFKPGGSDVVITSMSRPALFIHWLCGRFPERSDEVEVLASRCAALSVSEQHYIRGIGATAAQREVERLAELGVTAHVRLSRRSMVNWLIAGALLWSLMFWGLGASTSTVLLVLIGVLGAALTSLLRTGRRATGSFLGLDRTWTMRLRWFVPSAMVTTVVVGLSCLFLRPTSGVTEATLWGSLLGVIAYGVWGRSLWRGSSVPQLLSPTQRGGPLGASVQPSAKGPGRQGFFRRAWASKGLVCAAALLVLMEISTGFAVDSYVVAARRVEAQMSVTAEDAGAMTMLRGTRPDPGRHEEVEGWRSWWTQPLGFLGALSVGLGFTALGRRRRRRLDGDLRDIEREVDEAAGRFRLERAPPATRRAPSHRGYDARVTAVSATDGFTSAAVCRASSLAHVLGEGATIRLTGALKSLSNSPSQRVEAGDASLYARCILETDEEQAARFQFLALEGELEAAAATEWWEAHA
ncbi:MAG: serine/threonine-protein kinase [Myxococcota bacterium]